MSTPLKEDLEKIINEKPNDEIFGRVKDYLPKISQKAESLRKKIVDLIVEDLVLDLALSDATDSIGEILEYLIQDKSIERPEFSAEPLMKNIGRLSKLALSLKYAELIELPAEALNQMVNAEIERLWFDPVRHEAHSQKQTRQKPMQQTLALPDEAMQLLKSISKLMGKEKPK
jgi:hypothetical protein